MMPLNNIKVWLIISLTLGLAPFTPEPHVWGKLKWVLRGANGMQLSDWLDFLMHGLPWVFLVRAVIVKYIKREKA